MTEYNDKPEYSGIFITLEGVDGCGKSTQAEFLAQKLEELGYKVICLREPGGTVISEEIRALLLDKSSVEMSDDCELLLYEAARAQLTRQVIAPALAAGKVVLCDRYYDSTYAYQASARGLDKDLVIKANRIGSCGYTPDITFVLDIDPKEAFLRATKRDELDRLELEGISFQQKVRQGYLELCETEDRRMHLIDAKGSIDQIKERISLELENALAGLGYGK